MVHSWIIDRSDLKEQNGQLYDRDKIEDLLLFPGIMLL